MKKAEGLALQTIVIAAIVLVVLIVSILIFTKGIGPARIINRVNDCDGNCVANGGGCNTGEVAIYGLGCETENDGTTPYCCKKNEPAQ